LALERDVYAKSPETLLVGLARTGDRGAFQELVQRRQRWIRGLMGRCCNDATLADDLAQQTFLQAWKNIHRLQHPDRFPSWLKRLAINTWLQHARRNDPLAGAAEYVDQDEAREDAAGIAMDLDRALAALPDDVRLCVVLSYHERMTHDEIAAFTRIPLGTVKSHIRRGTAKLQEMLGAYLQADSIGVRP